MKKSSTITFRGKAARLAFEAITGTKLPPAKSEPHKLSQPPAPPADAGFDKWEAGLQPGEHARVVKAAVDKRVSIQERFMILSQKWKEEVAAESSLSKITGNINYLTVIGLGKGAVPIILSDLQKTGAPWFVALEAITGRTGVGAEYPGNFRKKKELWLQWGREQGYI